MITGEATPQGFGQVFTSLDVGMKIKAKAALTQLALVVEKQAKTNARNGAHKYGTPTPARPGMGPAVISGTLRRSITHTTIKAVGIDYEILVGMGVGFYPSYGKQRTTSSKYAYYLETGLKNGSKYPFLVPAFNFAMSVAAPTIYRDIFGAAWNNSL